MHDSREHILTTSMALFLQKSYRDVTMSEIVQKTGLSKGAFYHYFSGKEELFKEIVMMFMTMGAVDYSSFRRQSLAEFYLDYIDFLDQSMQKITLLLVDSGSKSRSFNFFMIMFEAVGRFPEFLKIELEFHNRDMQAWTSMIALARKSGEIRSVSTDEEIADLFLYCTDGVFLRFVNNDKPATFKEFLLRSYHTIYANLRV